MTQGDILLLACVLAEVRGVKLRTVSRWVSGGHNPNLFDRLARGGGCTPRTVDLAGDWFRAALAAHVEWPPGVPRQKPVELRKRRGVPE